MTRTILAIATALLATTTLFASGAKACISCSYTPEVLHASEKSYKVKSVEKQRAYAASKELNALAAQKRIAKSAAAAKKVETAHAAPAEKEADTETKTVATASSVDAEAAPAQEAKVAGNVGCKKFFPAVGATVTVPCE
jgi:hypothetical protein